MHSCGPSSSAATNNFASSRSSRRFLTCRSPGCCCCTARCHGPTMHFVSCPQNSPIFFQRHRPQHEVAVAKKLVKPLPNRSRRPGHGNKAPPALVGIQYVAQGRNLCGESPTSLQPTKPKTLQVHAIGLNAAPVHHGGRQVRKPRRLTCKARLPTAWMQPLQPCCCPSPDRAQPRSFPPFARSWHFVCLLRRLRWPLPFVPARCRCAACPQLLPACCLLVACLLPTSCLHLACLSLACRLLLLVACFCLLFACFSPACCLLVACFLHASCLLVACRSLLLVCLVPACCLLLPRCLRCCLHLACLSSACCLLLACFLPACGLLVACLLPACCLLVACLLPACCLLVACLLLLAVCLLSACCLPACLLAFALAGSLARWLAGLLARWLACLLLACVHVSWLGLAWLLGVGCACGVCGVYSWKSVGSHRQPGFVTQARSVGIRGVWFPGSSKTRVSACHKRDTSRNGSGHTECL